LDRFTKHASPISNPYFKAHIKLSTPHTDLMLNAHLDRFRAAQGAGMAIIDPLQTPDPVAIGLYIRSSSAMIIRHYIEATNVALAALKCPPVLLMWDNSYAQPVSEWDSTARVKPSSILIAYATEATAAEVTAGVRHLYTNALTVPPLGRQMLFCPVDEFWSESFDFIHTALDGHLSSMMSENINSEIKGLLPMATKYPDEDSSDSIRDMFLSATVDNTPDTAYLFTSIEQSGLRTRFLFYEDVGVAARTFLEDINKSVVDYFDAVDEPSTLYLPNYGPSRANSTLVAEFAQIKHLLPTTNKVAKSNRLLTNGPSQQNSFLSTLMNGNASDPTPGEPAGRNDGQLARRSAGGR
jgi:hypothetical protein